MNKQCSGSSFLKDDQRMNHPQPQDDRLGADESKSAQRIQLPFKAQAKIFGDPLRLWYAAFQRLKRWNH